MFGSLILGIVIYNTHVALLTSSNFSKYSVKANTLHDIQKNNLEVPTYFHPNI